MKIIGFVGGPHKDGNTAFVVNGILDGLKAKGAQTQVFYAGGMNVRPCLGCRACMGRGGCVINDDMKSFFESFKTCDGFVFGSPNYMGQMSGQAKTFLDRFSSYVVPRFSPKFNPEYANKKLVLVFTQGNPDKNKFQTYYDYTKEMFKMLEFDVKNIVVAANTRDQNAIKEPTIQIEIQTAVDSLLGC